MLFELIASVILLGMMVIPLINIVVGVVAGAALAGPPGALVGLAIAILVMAAEQMIGAGWFVPKHEVAPPGKARPISPRMARHRKFVLRRKRRPLLPTMPAYLRARLPLGMPLADGFGPETSHREKKSVWLH